MPFCPICNLNLNKREFARDQKKHELERTAARMSVTMTSTTSYTVPAPQTNNLANEDTEMTSADSEVNAASEVL